MLQNLTVGAQGMGLPEFQKTDKKVDRSSKDDRTDSFGKQLEAKTEKPDAKKAASPQIGANSSKMNENRSEKNETPTDQDIKSEAPPGPEKKIKVAATGRSKAIQDFMDSFESEFGISATRIVAAMAKLDPSQLEEKPEITAEAVVSELGLDEDQQARAAEMYAQLLMNLNRIDQSNTDGKELAPVAQETSKFLAGSAFSERVNAANARKLFTHKSVDTLNQKFWMKTPDLAKEATPSVEMFSGGDLSKLDLDSIDSDQLITDDLSEVGLENPSEPKTLEEALERLEMATEDLSRSPSEKVVESDYKRPAIDADKLKAEFQRLAQQKEAATLGQPSAQAIPVEDLNPRMMKAKKLNEIQFDPNQSKMIQASMGLAAQQMSQGQQNMGKQSESGSSFSQKQAQEMSSAVKGDAVISPELLGALTQGKPDMSLDKLAPMLTGAQTAHVATPKDNEANIQQVLNQAQYLIKKGGGEVNVKMTPEGLGQIQLKVQLVDGKVSIQMATDTPEAKKAIESGLSELKAGLAAHKFSVDHVKVDVVGQTNTENNSQGNMNFDSNAHQRDQSLKQYWNQFQENFGNRGQRDSFYDMTNIKGYPSGRKADPLQPIETSQARPAQSKDGKKGSGLNLVA